MFGEFVAGAKAGEFYFDLFSGGRGGGAVVADHFLGEVDDLDWVAEFRDEDGGRFVECGGGEDQVDGFVDGKEIAAGVGVRDGDGAAARDLLLEERDDAAS